MKILIVSTLKRRIGPDIFASRSRMIYQLATGLSNKGHEVSLLGTADSVVPGVTVIPVTEKGWVDLPPVENEFQREVATLILQARKIRELQDSFDVIHNHTYPDFFPGIIDGDLKIPMVTTLHALYDYYMEDVLAGAKYSYHIALSEGYRRLYKKVTFDAVVYNGIDTNAFAYQGKKSDYLLWLGRLPKAKSADGTFMDPKGIRWAIKLAQKTGYKLKLYGVVEDKQFYETDVKPHLNDNIQWVGAVSSEQSLAFEEVIKLMQHAKAFLMTINQQEPFGLVMAEALSSGTPVIAFDRGSVKEIVIDGKTGFTVDPADGLEGLVNAVKKLETIKPADCRERAVTHFSIDAMIHNHEKLYKELIRKHSDLHRS